MIPELGHVALILALCFAALQAVIPLWGLAVGSTYLQSYARPMVWAQFFFTLVSFIALTYCFIVDDFSVDYVAKNSNSLLPVYYKFSAVWGSHEGSLLLWVLLLSLWTFAVSIFSKQLPRDMLVRVLSVMGLVSVGFVAFTVITSNPFLRTLINTPLDGADLNPLLQDFGLIIHPPMLYMGYVGFSVAFAFAIAALMSGRMDSAWARWSRPWTNMAWAFLTVGIALGSWWAYYELGWGGWWFWDPVENASLMPWLVGTALIHSLAVTEKRGVFKSWTVFLAIFAFCLSLLGTFLVRSGVLTSVHAFATDPERGTFILALLGFYFGGALALYAVKAPTVVSQSRFSWLSRESFLLANNLLLVIMTIAVLMGTLYPLLFDYMGWGKMSVGAPWFNAVFVPVMGLLMLLMAFGELSRWKKTKSSVMLHKLPWIFVFSVTIALAYSFYYAQGLHAWTLLGVTLSFWVILTTIRDMWDKSSNKQGRLVGVRKLSRSYMGMVLGHFGIAVTAMGITLVSNFTIEEDLRMGPGDTLDAGGYQFEFVRVDRIEGPNYTADSAIVNVYENGKLTAQLAPEKRHYTVQNNMMTEAAIDPGLFRDLYVAMGEPLDDGAWAMRLQYKPYIRWLWLGAILMGLGATLAILDKRYRLNRRKVVSA
jgi:cytochrome c-type biogenesis protein CcmF